jgi:hypothetical protein
MFIDNGLLYFLLSSVGAASTYFAPTELGKPCGYQSYKHPAPTELRPLNIREASNEFDRLLR